MQSNETSDEYRQVLTQTVRTVSARQLSLPFVSYRKNKFGGIDSYTVTEIIKDFAAEPKPLEALIALYERSDCPLVAEFREAVYASFNSQCADSVEKMKEGVEA